MHEANKNSDLTEDTQKLYLRRHGCCCYCDVTAKQIRHITRHFCESKEDNSTSHVIDKGSG